MPSLRLAFIFTGDTGKPCGIDYELKAFVGETAEDKPHKRNSVRLAIRKVMYAPSKPGDQPSVEVSKEFIMSPSKLHLECSLDKEVGGHVIILRPDCSKEGKKYHI